MKFGINLDILLKNKLLKKICFFYFIVISVISLYATDNINSDAIDIKKLQTGDTLIYLDKYENKKFCKIRNIEYYPVVTLVSLDGKSGLHVAKARVEHAPKKNKVIKEVDLKKATPEKFIIIPQKQKGQVKMLGLGRKNFKKITLFDVKKAELGKINKK